MIAIQNKEWATRLRSTGDVREQAVADLRDILMAGLAATCKKRYNGRIQLEDAVQSTLIKILSKLDSFEGRSKLTTWAMAIGVRTAISEMRHRHFKDVLIGELLWDGIRFEPEAKPDRSEHENERASVLAKLQDLIETELSAKQNMAIHSMLQGIPIEVLAEKTGSNRNAVYKLIHDARGKLKKGFERAGYQAEDIASIFA